MPKESTKPKKNSGEKIAVRILAASYDPKIMFFCCLWLIIMLVLGTWEQKDIGIYQAHKKFFSAWFVPNYFFLPIPGTRLILAIMALNLTSKLVFNTSWRLAKFGVNLTHLGISILLVGGFYTAYFSKEGSMSIPEKGSTNIVEDYYDFELAITENINNKEDNDVVTVFPPTYLRKGKVLSYEGNDDNKKNNSSSLPFTIKVVDFYKNTKLLKGAIKSRNNLKPKGAAEHFHLEKQIYNPEKPPTNAGLIMEIYGEDKNANGIYFLRQHTVMPFRRIYNGRTFTFELRHRRWFIPYTIELINFTKEFHPHTDIPRNFQSEVFVKQGEVSTRAIIKMNHPLRKKNFTFFQAKFIEASENNPEISILAVVENAGKFIPYLSCLVICFGILCHLLIKIFQRMQKSKKTK